MKNGTRKKLDGFALFLPEINEFLRAKDFNGLKALLKNINSMDMAEGWRYLEPNAKIIIFRLLGPKKALEVFESLKLDEQTYVVNNLNNDEISHIINEMAPDDR